MPGVADLEFKAVMKPAMRDKDARGDYPEIAGWDLTDNKRKPLKLFEHFHQPLWLAIRGVAGALPFHAENAKAEGWVSKLEAEASRFRKR